MNFLERSDAKFVAQAADDSQRSAAIERLSGVRNWTLRLAILMSLCFLVIFMLGALHPTFGAVGGALGLGFSTIIQWVNLMKFESDLRLLKVVEMLRR